MKRTTIALLCLFLILVGINISQAGTKGKLGGVIKLFKKPSTTKPKATIIKESKKPTQTNQGSYPRQPGSYPQQPGSYPQQPGSYPQQPGSYPQQPGSYPQQPGSYPQQPGSYPQQPGRYPQQPGSYPQQPGSYPQQPGGYPQQPGSYPQQPGGYPQQPGSYPQQPGGYPQQPGSYPRQSGSYPQQPGSYPQQPGSYPQQPGGYPRQPGSYPQQSGGYPRQPGDYPYPAGYPQQPGYPVRSYPVGGHPPQGSPYGGHLGTYGGYPGGYINYNPNNKILSPHYGGSFGYGGYGGGGGSPFSHSVNAMGYAPSDKSRGFGRTAVMAAAGGAMAGMALGYGLGRFPRPDFQFHSREQEYFYNYYMYKKYGVQSTDGNDYSRDYTYSQSAQGFDKFMTSCMKRTDLLPVENRKQQNKPLTPITMTTKISSVKTTTAATVTAISSNSTNVNRTDQNPSPPGLLTPSPLNASEVNPITPASVVHDNKTVDTVETGSLVANTTTVVATVSGPGHPSGNNKTSAENPPSVPHVQEKPEVEPSQLPKKEAADDDEDTVSIVEIGYPALINQVKVKRCTELYVVHTERQLKKKTTTTPTPQSGAQRLQIGLGEQLSVVTSIILMILNTNMQDLLH
uniref:Prion protein, related sequence 3 n=2 Tax=Salarias fasciatus TaxID=181472 RepID=A0A672J5J4_SALFA